MNISAACSAWTTTSATASLPANRVEDAASAVDVSGSCSLVTGSANIVLGLQQILSPTMINEQGRVQRLGRIAGYAGHSGC